jgi:acyl-CoA thioester hydrolase
VEGAGGRTRSVYLGTPHFTNRTARAINRRMTTPARIDTELRVRYGETDQMGIVYHPVYLMWCEIGRTEYMRQLGMPYASLEARGTLLAVADASLRYHAPARYDDMIRIETIRAHAAHRDRPGQSSRADPGGRAAAAAERPAR